MTDIERMVESYQKRWKTVTNRTDMIRALGWGTSEERYLLRREHTIRGFRDGGGLKPFDKVLDVGSGPGLLGMHLTSLPQRPIYTAIDAVPEFIDHVRSSVLNAEAIVGDICSIETLPKCDWAIADGVFNYKWSHLSNFDEAMRCMEKMVAAARRGVVMSFMGDEVDFREDHLFYFNAGEVFKRAKAFSRRVNLRYSAPVFEFWIDIYPDFKGWRVG